MRRSEFKSPNDLSDLSIAEVKNAVIESQNSSLVMIFGSKIAQGHIVFPFAFNDKQEKTLLVEALRKFVQDVGANQTWLITEAWMVRLQAQKPGDTLDDVEAERAKLPPDLGDAEGRVEILICQHETPAETTLWFFDIVRDAEGRITDLTMNGDKEFGSFTTFNIWLLKKPEKLTVGGPTVYS